MSVCALKLASRYLITKGSFPQTAQKRPVIRLAFSNFVIALGVLLTQITCRQWLSVVLFKTTCRG